MKGHVVELRKSECSSVEVTGVVDASAFDGKQWRRVDVERRKVEVDEHHECAIAVAWLRECIEGRDGASSGMWGGAMKGVEGISNGVINDVDDARLWSHHRVWSWAGGGVVLTLSRVRTKLSTSMESVAPAVVEAPAVVVTTVSGFASGFLALAILKMSKLKLRLELDGGWSCDGCWWKS
jgi:hypothetical protein